MNYLQERVRAELAKYRRSSESSADPNSVQARLKETKLRKIPSTVSDPVSPGQINPLMYQSFEWYTPSDPHSNSHYGYLISKLTTLERLGVSTLWLPPGCKAGNPKGNGYDIYDLWDLGEFDWKGQRPTKWGSREELDQLCRTAKDRGIGLLWDAVLSHRSAADWAEEVKAVEVDDKDMYSGALRHFYEWLIPNRPHQDHWQTTRHQSMDRVRLSSPTG
jgi:glycosidase